MNPDSTGIRSRARWRPALRALAASLALAASRPALAADPKPCEVLTEADVEAALGGDWKPVAAIVSEEESCAYQGSGATFVTLLLTGDSGGAAAILAGRRRMAGDKAKAASGPGAGAFRLSLPQANGIVFGKGKWVAQIDTSHSATTDPTVLDRLAKAAYDRLP
jgi:hypothetical protein